MALDCYSLVRSRKPRPRIVRMHCHWQSTRQAFPSMKLASNLRSNMDHLGEKTTTSDKATVCRPALYFTEKPAFVLEIAREIIET